MLLLFKLAQLNDHLFVKELFIRFTVRVFHERLCNFVCVLLSLFGFEGGMRDLIVFIPDHCLSIYFYSKCRPFLGRASRGIKQAVPL